MSGGVVIAESTPSVRGASKRSFWIRQITLWHWVSSGACLAGMLLFTITGITLNHAADISATPQILKQQSSLPPPMLRALAGQKSEGKFPLPAGVSAWLSDRFAVKDMAGIAEWSEPEIYVSLPRAGGDAWISIDRATGIAKFEKTDRGWIAYLNDLHKGRNTGSGWQIFIDVLGAACLIFTFTGLVLLQVHAAKRPATWPVVTFGMLIPILLMLFLVHR